MRPGIVTPFVLALCLALSHAAQAAGENGEPRRLRDMLWVWGNPEMAVPGPHTVETFAAASPAERAELLGVRNIILAGHGLPADDLEAAAITGAAAGADRLVWEITSGDNGGAPYVYGGTCARLSRLRERHPQVEAVLLDDMSSQMIPSGFRPEDIDAIRKALGENGPEIWGVYYSMNFGVENIDEYIRRLDAINLWVWHAKDLPQLDAYVTECETRYPDKPIILGLYLYDYGDGRAMPPALLKEQCDTALKLAHAGRIEGVVFLTITDDAQAVAWTREWIAQVGDEPLGEERHEAD